MFHTTYLGHQGWLIESGPTRLLVDPLLGERLLGTLGDCIDIYPPRVLDLAAFPPIDAVVISHEHPDHLNVPSLLRLERTIPVFIPGRASLAARSLLAELGFQATLLHPGRMVTVGALEVHPYHSEEITRDEWDVTPLLVRDRAGEGSLGTSIDAPESNGFARFATERAGRVGAWASSHNHVDLFPLDANGKQEADEVVTARLARDFLERFDEQFRSGPKPGLHLVLASGFSFGGDLAWMNRHVFPARADRVARLLAEKRRDVLVCAPLPGQRFSQSGGRCVATSEVGSFVAVKDPSAWPVHAAEPLAGAVPDYAPATRLRTLAPEELERLLVELRGFAAHLYGGALMKSLYASSDSSFALSLRNGEERLTLAYRPEACAFERFEGEARESHTAGFECWASDLLAVLRLELVAGFLTLGRCRTWNKEPERLRCDLASELALYTHPLRMPDRTLEQYRRMVAALGSDLGPERIASARARA